MIPDGAQVISVRVDGRWTEISLTASAGAEQTLNVPTPVGVSGLAIEVNWERVIPEWGLWKRIRAAVPKFPGQAPDGRSRWSLARIGPGEPRESRTFTRLCREPTPGASMLGWQDD